jgi:hypothetical protein
MIDIDEEKKGFKFNPQDNRFTQAYQKSDFAVDPTSKFYNPKTSENLRKEQNLYKKKKQKLD